MTTARIFDTNLYTDWLNAGKHGAILFQADTFKFVSSAVMMELLAGASAPLERSRLHDLFTTFTKVSRTVTLASATYREAGDVLQELQVTHGYDLKRCYSLANDVLIALSTRTIGGMVVTQNTRDFLAIQSLRPFKLRRIS